MKCLGDVARNLGDVDPNSHCCIDKLRKSGGFGKVRMLITTCVSLKIAVKHHTYFSPPAHILDHPFMEHLLESMPMHLQVQPNLLCAAPRMSSLPAYEIIFQHHRRSCRPYICVLYTCVKTSKPGSFRTALDQLSYKAGRGSSTASPAVSSNSIKPK